MKLVHFLSIFIIFLLAQQSFAEEELLDYFSWYQKISHHLIGHGPSPQDYANLRKAIAENREEEFINDEISRLMTSPLFYQKLTYKVHELFQLKPPGRVRHLENSRVDAFYRNSDRGHLRQRLNENNSFYQLIYRTIQFNKPWSNLLTAKRYKLYRLDTEDDDNDQPSSDYDFYGAIAKYYYQLENDRIRGAFSSESRKNELYPFYQIVAGELNASEDDERLAGLITTESFFRRYTNSSINKNRKRAAAIFRIFLCDPMAAALPEASEDDQELFDLLLPEDLSPEAEQLVSELKDSEKLHGTRADCMKCHRKLDPLGKTLLTSGRYLSPFAGPGALVFTGKNNREVNVRVGGIGGIANAIVEQPEYIDCQIKHFWNWFIGTDVELTGQNLVELREFAHRSNFKTKDIVWKLLHSKEFRVRPKPKTPYERRVGKIKSNFVRCNNCHDSSAYIYIPYFDRWPIGGNQEQHQYWVDKIAEELDLSHMDQSDWKPSMPPKWSAWRPEREDLSLIQWWIEEGAPYEE